MNIYFVNRYSKLKGPFDIIDSNRQHIIKVGDICLRNTVEGVAFYVVYNSTNTWNACKLVGVGKNETLPDIGNTLLFSFDGLSRRKGDIALIKLLTLCFREKVIDDFFGNAVDILAYKKDFWEGSLFPQFFAASQELVDRDKQGKSDVNTEKIHYPSIFAQYLSKELLELLITNLNDGYELKEAYQILRKKHPEMFRKALMKFLTENPSGTIFDRPAETFVPTVTVTEVEIPKAASQYNKPLEADDNIDEEPLETNKRIDSFLIEIGRESLLSVDEEVELAQKIRKGDIGARNILVSANMRFVVGLAKQYLHKGIEFEDLIQEGFLGLIKAAERFDETRGFSFIHYAPWWIKRYQSDAIVKDSSLIQFPLSVQILHRRIWDFKVKYEHKNGFLPPITEIEVDDDENLERISFLDRLPNNLNDTCIPCEDLDVFEDSHNDIWDYDDNEYNNCNVRSLLVHLSRRERDILIRVFGIGVSEETLESIGESHGLTRERVRQIKEKAIKKLREIVFATKAGGQLFGSQDARKEESPVQTISAKDSDETQTLRDVKEAFLQNRSNTVQFKETTPRKKIDLNTRIYSVVNYNGKCSIYDYNKKRVYSSTGNVMEINKSYFRVSLTHSFLSIGLIKRNFKGKLFNANKILLANHQSELYYKLNCKGFLEMIEDVEIDGRRRVKVDGSWFDEHGNEVLESNNSESIIIEQHEEAKESIEANNTRKLGIPNAIDEFGIEHVFVDSYDGHPYRDEEVELEQTDKDKVAEGEEKYSVWSFAENIRFAKRSKQFFKCKCCVGLSKSGYYLIVNQRFIKLGDYPDGYKYNVGNIWIKRPIDDRGYRMIHENEEGGHLIGYVTEKGEIVMFTNPANDVYSVTFDGRITSGIKSQETISIKDTDIDKLRHAFDKKATSYKYFWFLAIMKIHHEFRMGTILFKDILIEMVSIAWKYAFVENSEFPQIDQLPNYLRKIQEKSYLDRYAKENRVKEVVRAHYHEWNCNTLLMPFLNNVPYRFLSPWIPFTNNEEVIAKSNKTESRCPYNIAKDYITINPLWSDYIVENYDKIRLFIEKELRFYLKCK